MSQVNRISKTGLELIKGFEGLRRRSEPLPGGGWIVGYSHTRSAREGVEVTEREAEYLLRYDLQAIESFVSHNVHAPLNQNEFDALVSLCWNIGKESFSTSDVLNYVNAGEMLAAAESFSAWRKARIGGRLIVVDALVRRRTAEKNLFLSHPSGPPAAPSLMVRPELDVAASVLALSDGALSIEAKMNAPGRNELKSALPGLVANDQFAKVKPTENIVVDVEDAETVDLLKEDQRPEPVPAAADNDLEPASVTNAALDSVDDDLDKGSEDDKVLPPLPSVITSDEEDIGTVWDETDLDDLEDEDVEPVYDLDDADTDVEDDESDNDLALDDVVELQDLDDSSHEETLSRAMTAASLVEKEPVLTEDLREDEVLTEDKPLHDEEAELPEVFSDDDDDPGREPTGLELSCDMIDDSEDIADLSESDDESWNGGPETEVEPATVFESTGSDRTAQDKRIVINDYDHPNGMTVEEIEALDPDTAFPHSASLQKRNVVLAMLPFLLLALIGLVMMGLGLYDWWGLLQSDRPINENELYAGPFLTLIGGFGLVFGLYFTIRKLMSKDR